MSTLPARHRVVVTGIGTVTPLGVGTERVWSRLLAGASGVGPIRGFDAGRLPVRIAAEVTEFDPTDWLTHKEARRLDRFCHFAIAAAELAVERAGLDGIDRDGAATVIGSAIGGAATMMAGALKDAEAPQMVSPFFVPSSIVNMGAGTVAQRFGFRGPGAAPVTACASSADAIGQAYRMVRDGYAGAALAGGAEACVISPLIAGFANLRALSRRNDEPHRASRPFTADRDGFVMGEGATMLLLETAESAEARGAHVHAEICGYGQTSDAYHVTAPDPTGEGAARAMLAALREAGLAPEEIDHINAHGTSTLFSDAAETKAIKSAFGPHSKNLAVSSTKSMTGHLLGAAGATEAAFCALAIDRGVIPPTINQDAVDPECDLDYVPNTARPYEVRAALSNSFAFGGQNVSLALRRFVRQ
ncbi:beta-ketoacyl-ACP synthase II (plasmid) [Streptomyces sp. NBC_01260]|uniref:beta-ketoacyl-ACP synthase II n=1 Tax=unclassified Streptomyces TaxID=2593676 RepID=UPI000F487FBE|nr:MULTISPECIES: beta-ketoacyl-ACP synthase II [unclassified Streptomyces]MCX4775234.1 beta-ketoacyl-ACP synthase II [Streptomyces sp. NBC_01285]ROQ65351.1 3-oxoacyl-[acyl-carrier-protein] synthase II [Streptomyces sp. CEV 2-1]RPK32913.1 3-oxoacyl-[acyl-carrier-protein] synthase 2 [Streptomyces sp. ADI92-24]